MTAIEQLRLIREFGTSDETRPAALARDRAAIDAAIGALEAIARVEALADEAEQWGSQHVRVDALRGALAGSR